MTTDCIEASLILLIECVRKRPVLYDKSHVHYSNVIYRDQTWEDIAKEISSTDLECKRKWNYLRGKFARETKRFTENKCTGEKSSWPLLQNLTFLNEHCTRRMKPKTVNESDTTSNSMDTQSIHPLTEITFPLDRSTPRNPTCMHNTSMDLIGGTTPIERHRPIDFFNEPNLQYSSPSSSGLPPTYTISIGTNTDIDQKPLDHMCINNTDPATKRLRFFDEIEDVVQTAAQKLASSINDVLVKNKHIPTISSTNLILDNFAKFVSSTLEDIPLRRRNEAMSYITNYLLNIRSEENI